MVKLNYADLRFDHLVEFAKDSTIFAAARYNGDALRIFLIYKSTGNVYTRNGRADTWEELDSADAEIIRNRVTELVNIPIYRINGSHH